MSTSADHLPECKYGLHYPCICDALRACEQRIKQSISGLSWYSKARWTGYYEGVDAAEAAVAAQHWTHRTPESWAIAYEIGDLDVPEDAIMLRSDALSAIGALKEKP